MAQVAKINRYNLLPDRTVCREQNTPCGIKRDPNADGSDKCKPTMIGRSAALNAFKNAHINKNSLPVIIRRHGP